MPFGAAVGNSVDYLQFRYDLGRGYRDRGFDMATMKDRDDNYDDDVREERAERARLKRRAYEYAGPGYIRANDLEEDEQ